MEYVIKNRLEKLQEKLPDHFGDTFYELKDYKRQKGIIKFSVQGYHDKPYIFEADLAVIKKLFAWLEGILESPYSEDHCFSFFEIKKEKALMVGYLPISKDGNYREADVSADFPALPLRECGMYYVYDIEKNKILESTFVYYEDLVRRIYTTIKRCNRLRTSSEKIISHFLDKDEIVYEFNRIVCKGVISKVSLRYSGAFYDSNGAQIEHWGIADEYESAFKSHARRVIKTILEHREYKRKNEAWKATNDIDSIGCVFDIMPELFRQRLIDGKYDKSLNNKVVGGDYEVPLPYVTKAWDYLLKDTLCANEFRVEYDPEYDDPVVRTREVALQQNDQMKLIWKEFFNIDIDTLEVDFRKFDMHLPPNVSDSFARYYFQYVPDGVEEWILEGINSPNGHCCFDAVSSLMEFAAYIGVERLTWVDD